MSTNTPLVQIHDVVKAYGEHVVLHDVNFNIQQGEFVAFVGESGGGKSTLLRLVAGLEATTSGEILVGDMPVVGINKAARVMFQDDRLLPWMTVLDNLSFKSRDEAARTRAKELLQLVQLADYANSFPGQLSGGQKQRVALARALMSSPKLLLLDEPLGALDALTRLRMQELIADIVAKENLTTILITHDVREAAKMADRIVAIKHGTVGLEVAGLRGQDDELAMVRAADTVQDFILAN
jgi:sulfonate transport system ATP-binding protein